MPDKPSTAAGYAGGATELVRATCLYLATKLGDLTDEVVVVGGFVPSLIVDQAGREGADLHVGTMDLDIGLGLTLLDGGRYEELAARMRRAGMAPDHNATGRPTRQRWRTTTGTIPMTVDFLIAPLGPTDRPGRLRDLEADFAALIAPGLALAFHNRGENKDAYDLCYVVRNFGAGPSDVARALRPLLDAQEAAEALQILARDFSTPNALGPRQVAEFLSGGPDDEVQADAVAAIEVLLRATSP